MTQRRTNLWCRLLYLTTTRQADRTKLCEDKGCTRPASYVVGWENPPSARLRWGSIIKCSKHAIQWHRRNKEHINTCLYPEPC